MNVLNLFFISVGILFSVKILYVIGIVLSIKKTKGALFVFTPSVRIEYALENIDLKKGQQVVDLGCGDGRILISVLKKFDGVIATGYEINFFPYLIAKIRSFFYKDLTIKRKNFLKADLKNVDVIFCYLFPDLMKDVAMLLSSNHKKGALLISFNFPLPGYNPLKVLKPSNTIHNEPIFIYKLDDH